MPPRGTKPIPPELKVLAGNPGGRPIPNTPKPPTGATVLRCPPHLRGEARKQWRKIAKDLYGSGLLTKIDRPALSAYCTCWDRWLQAEDHVREHGVILRTKTGYPVQNPSLAIAAKAMKQMMAILTEFGMTPSSRARIHVEPEHGTSADPEDDEFGLG
jgi:P27 family predicted phage terminase small subunit